MSKPVEYDRGGIAQRWDSAESTKADYSNKNENSLILAVCAEKYIHPDFQIGG